STLKVLVPLVALVGLVFGVTLLFLYTPGDEKAPGPVERGTGEPLTFFTSTRHFDPRPMWEVYTEMSPPTAADHFFPGFFEKNEKTRTAFWFENRNDKPVAMQLKH